MTYRMPSTNLLSTVQPGELVQFIDALKRDVFMPAWRLLPGRSLRERLDQFFINKNLVKFEDGRIKFKPTIARIYRASYGWHVILGLYPGLSIDSIMDHYSELCYTVQGECSAWMDNSHWMHIKVFNKGMPDRFRYQEKLAKRIAKYPLALPIGISRQGFEILKLYLGENYGVLIVGMPRWGKSVWFRQALTAIVTAYKPESVWMFLIDLKDGVEFEKFHGCPHTKDWSGDSTGAKRVLKAILIEISRRSAVFKKARVTSILEYNDLGKDYMPHMVLAVDEYALLDDECKQLIHKICVAGSFAGTHPLLCIQRPTTDGMPGATKAMLPVRLCFKTADKDNSRWALGDKITVAASIRNKGRAVYLNGNPRLVQVMWIEPKDCEKLLQSRFPVAQQRGLQLVQHFVP